MRLRAALVGVGVLVGVYGGYLLLSLGPDNLVAAAIWLAAGVILHDAVLGPLLVVLAAIVLLLVPRRVRGPVVAGLVVLGTVTMTAVPVLGRFGARPDNATLLPRDYTLGWLVFAALVAVVTAVGVLRALRDDRSTKGDARRLRGG
jgi:hypothetical protein